MNNVDALRRIQQVQPGGVTQEKTLKQFLVQPVSIVGQLIKAVLMPAGAKIERCVTQGGMLVYEQAFALVAPGEFQGKVQRQRCDSGSTFGPNQRNDLAMDFGAQSFL